MEDERGKDRADRKEPGAREEGSQSRSQMRYRELDERGQVSVPVVGMTQGSG